ncbi:hypothetical protein OEV98_15130 [Caldibacillus lycopersici]|uniref:Uncharacterized protein n=1 Tax=Perspicuibacillus lycopersici TaxID=1325689 RepID=A0AAE3LPD6_9BACI|nr:hypothetical protein [Perspicuibacillus lycopersici]MCU9614876.1 hypothetical protein [Perspicuibacillus lycopersici]
MNAFWNFPAATGGLINSINNAGLETFRGNALESLTREICQNSLDAVKDNKKPVIVEFQTFQIHSDRFPNRSEFIDVLYKCQDTWQGRNQKSEEFLRSAISQMHMDHIPFLRISDFNTKGLEGADSGEIGTPWSSLVKEAGSSNKNESSGGSFGIGKSAPFLNSKLRTLFYSSQDMTGYESYIGVANIMSYQKDVNSYTLGNGYFTTNENSTAIQGKFSLDPNFTRKETGTDIYVSGFHPVDNWEEEIRKSVLFNFFITVYQKKLVVKINGFEINDQNITDLILGLEDNEENIIVKNYFLLLTSNNTIKISYPAKKYTRDIAFDEGEANLYLLNGEDLNRRVLMTRKTGMRIFEQKNISGSISFTGLLMITGTNMNNIFKQMENPAHNEWSPERYEKNPKLAKRIYEDLRKFIRNTVKEHFQEKITDSMDATGLSDFLPNKSRLTDATAKRRETLSSTIKSIIKKEKKQEEVLQEKPKGTTNEVDIEKQLIGEFGITPGGNRGGNGTGKHAEGGIDGGGLTEPDGTNTLDPEEPGQTRQERQRKPSTQPIEMTHRYICTNKAEGKYRFMITPTKSLASARLVFTILGEQSNFALPVQTAETNDGRVTVDRISGDTIYLNSLKAKKNFILDVGVDYSDYCVMEVVLYEN